MTDYRIHSIAEEDGSILARVQVGKRDRLEIIALPRPDAWRLFRSLARALEVTE